ncbi:MAG: hypothetical protein VKQ33_01215 [Candidatus Sericytochromatia bacterium]|nr:hypothetical protein [Candidatus Sericytochromatia bacterium]
MTPRSPCLRLLAGPLAAALAGCGAFPPASLGPGARPASPLAVRGGAEPTAATTEPEVRLPITEGAFLRLRAALPFKAQAARVDHDYDLWDGRAFRRVAEPVAPRLRLKVRDGQVAWQVSRVLERRTLEAAGLPIGLTVQQSHQGRLKPATAQAILAPTERFFLHLDEGGERLRQQGGAVDLAWRAAAWPGAPAFGWWPAPLLSEASLLAPDQLPPARPMLMPAAMKRRHGWKAVLPPEQVGGGLKLFLHLDEARDEAGRWRDSFEIEAEPIARQGPAGLEAAATEFGRLLVAHGLTREDVAPPRGNAVAYTTGQLLRVTPVSPFMAPPLPGLEGHPRP